MDPKIEPTLMIFPLPRSIMCAATACEQRKVPVRLVRITLFHSSSVVLSDETPCITPALLTRMWTLPCHAAAFATESLTCFDEPTSVSIASARLPVLSIRLQVSSRFCGRLPQQTMSAPASARPSAMARPKPLPAPVTRATWPSSENHFSNVLNRPHLALLRGSGLQNRYRNAPR